jgi:hypothetical protein
MGQVDIDSDSLFRLRSFSHQPAFNPLDLACFPTFCLKYFTFYTACVGQMRSGLRHMFRIFRDLTQVSTCYQAHLLY